MPFYKIDDIDTRRDSAGGPAMAKTVAGELIKVAVVTYQDGEGPAPHYHPNEEQFLVVLEGRMQMILGDEQKIITRGDLVHIPRNAKHGVRAVGGPAVFFTCKSPVGDGDISQDYNKASDAEALVSRLATAR